MSTVASKYEEGVNFWKVNSHFSAIEPFKGLYSKDKSKDKSKSSYEMWAVVLCYDTDSQFFGMTESERKEMIAKDFLEDETFFTKPETAVLAEAYKKVTDTAARRQLRMWSSKMDEKSTFLAELKYDKATWKMIDEMLLSNKNLYADFSRIEKMLINEGNDMVEGGSEESLSEKGIFDASERK